MKTYFDELVRTMDWLASKDDTIFLGQAVSAAGTAITNTLKNVPMEKRFEMPVFENTQMGMSTGMALNGTIPVSIFPRWDFLLAAADQIVTHLDKIKEMSWNQFKPKVIIRTSVGSCLPLYPGKQHMNNHSKAFRLMCENIEIVELHHIEDIFPSYQRAYERVDGKSTILVEFADYLNQK